MTPEEFQRIKDAEKAHLRKLKELKQAVHQMERQRTLTRAVEDITTGTQSKLDEHKEMVERLALETARSEARLDMALESEDEKDRARRLAQETAALEEEARQARAKALLQQMKQELGGAPPADAPPAEARQTGEKTIGAAPAREDEGADPLPKPASLPDKTLGRMRPGK